MINVKIIALLVVLEILVINLALQINSLLKQHKLKKILAIVIENEQNEHRRELSLLEENEQENE